MAYPVGGFDQHEGLGPLAGRHSPGRRESRARPYDRTDRGRGRVGTKDRRAVEQADRLGTPPQRWQAQAALARALYTTGDDNGAELAFAASTTVVQDVAA